MGGLIDVSTWKDMFSIGDKDFNPKWVERHLGAGSRRLKGWVGVEAYTDAASSNPADADRKADLQLAEAFLGMHFAILGFNTRLDVGGVIKTKKVEGNTVITFLSPSEVKQLTQNYLEQAEEIARPYMLADGTPSPEIEILEAEE
jgi:hypothetical protein